MRPSGVPSSPQRRGEDGTPVGVDEAILIACLLGSTLPPRILGIKYLLSVIYEVGVSAKSSLQMTYTQNLGSKGLTGVFWRLSPISCHIAIRGNEELCIFPLNFPSIFPLKATKNRSSDGRRRMVFALVPPITIVSRGRVMICKTGVRDQGSEKARGVRFVLSQVSKSKPGAPSLIASQTSATTIKKTGASPNHDEAPVGGKADEFTA
jgi:hypothetical protein